MNCTTQDLQEQQTGDIIQILFVAFTVIPLIATEVLPFLPCEPNGIIHGLVLGLSKVKPVAATRATNVAHPRP